MWVGGWGIFCSVGKLRKRSGRCCEIVWRGRCKPPPSSHEDSLTPPVPCNSPAVNLSFVLPACLFVTRVLSAHQHAHRIAFSGHLSPRLQPSDVGIESEKNVRPSQSLGVLNSIRFFANTPKHSRVLVDSVPSFVWNVHKSAASRVSILWPHVSGSAPPNTPSMSALL